MNCWLCTCSHEAWAPGHGSRAGAGRAAPGGASLAVCLLSAAHSPDPVRGDSPQKQPVPASRKGPQGGTSGGGDWPTAFPCSARGVAGRLASDSVTYFWQTRWAQSRIWAQTSWRALPSDRCDVLLSPPAGSVPESRRMR